MQIEIQGEIVGSNKSQAKKKIHVARNSREDFLDVLAGGLAELVGVDPDEDEELKEEEEMV